MLYRYLDRIIVIYSVPEGHHVLHSGKNAWGQTESMALIDIWNSSGVLQTDLCEKLITYLALGHREASQMANFNTISNYRDSQCQWSRMTLERPRGCVRGHMWSYSGINNAYKCLHSISNSPVVKSYCYGFDDIDVQSQKHISGNLAADHSLLRKMITWDHLSYHRSWVYPWSSIRLNFWI